MKKLSLVLVLALVGISSMLAQRTITGTVTDEQGEPLIGVSIFARGTSVGTISDIDGTYSLRVPDDVNTLIYSYTGFTTKEVTLGGVTGDPRAETTRLVRPFNVLGWPALVLPCGFTSMEPGQPVTYNDPNPPPKAMPVGLQLVAAPGREDLLFQAGAALEDLFGLSGKVPE